MERLVAIRDIIVRVPKAYTDQLVLPSGFVLHLSTTIRESHDSVRYGTVVSVPEGCDDLDIQEGDVLFFHQNITSIIKTEEGDVDSDYLYDKKECLYRVPINKDWPLCYARERGNELKALTGVCFIKPIYQDKYKSDIIITDTKEELSNIGEVFMLSDSLREKGIKEGDMVLFEKDSEYEFRLNDTTLYCMFDNWIFGKVIVSDNK